MNVMNERLNGQSVVSWVQGLKEAVSRAISTQTTLGSLLKWPDLQKIEWTCDEEEVKDKEIF